MSDKPKSTVLDQYHDAISALPPDEQLERQQKIKSPKTLKRMLSEDAPEFLVARFAQRLNEVGEKNFSDYELGRIKMFQFLQEEEALKHFSKSAQNLDLRSVIWIAKLSRNTEMMKKSKKDEKETLRELFAIFNKDGEGHPATHYFLGDVELRAGNIAKAETEFQLAVEKSNNPEEIKALTRGKTLLTLGKRKEAQELLDPLAEKGDNEAISALINYARANQHYEDFYRYANLFIKFGFTGIYFALGMAQASKGKTEDAIESYRRGIKAGQSQCFQNLIELLLNKGSIEEAKAEAEKGIKAKIAPAYVAMMQILVYEDKNEEAVGIVKKAVEDDIDVPPLYRAATLYMDKKIDETEKFCLDQVKKDPRLHFLLSNIYRNKGILPKAKKHMEKAKIESGLAPLFREYDTLMRQRRLEEADELMKIIDDQLYPPGTLEKWFSEQFAFALGKMQSN